MFTLEDDLLLEARALLAAIAAELRTQDAAGEMAAVHVRALIRGSAPGEVREGEEVAYLGSIVDRLERLYPIADLFPSKRLKWAQRPRDEGGTGD